MDQKQELQKEQEKIIKKLNKIFFDDSTGDPRGTLSKIQEISLIQFLIQNDTYFKSALKENDLEIMKINIQDDTNLFFGISNPISIIKELNEVHNKEEDILIQEVEKLKIDVDQSEKHLHNHINKEKELKIELEDLIKENDKNIKEIDNLEDEKYLLELNILQRKTKNNEQLTEKEIGLLIEFVDQEYNKICEEGF